MSALSPRYRKRHGADTVANRRGLEARATGRPCNGALIEDAEKRVHQTALSGPLSWAEREAVSRPRLSKQFLEFFC